MQKLENVTVQNFLERLIESLMYESIRTCSEIENNNPELFTKQKHQLLKSA